MSGCLAVFVCLCGLYVWCVLFVLYVVFALSRLLSSVWCVWFVRLVRFVLCVSCARSFVSLVGWWNGKDVFCCGDFGTLCAWDPVVRTKQDGEARITPEGRRGNMQTRWTSPSTKRRHSRHQANKLTTFNLAKDHPICRTTRFHGSPLDHGADCDLVGGIMLKTSTASSWICGTATIRSTMRFDNRSCRFNLNTSTTFFF